jgi:hypothetical protein
MHRCSQQIRTRYYIGRPGSQNIIMVLLPKQLVHDEATPGWQLKNNVR